VILPAALGLLTLGLVVIDFRSYATNPPPPRVIRELKQNRDVVVSTGARPEALLARIEFLLSHDRIDEVQPLAEALDKTGSEQIMAAAHYNFANGRLRQAFDLLTQGKIDAAGPLVVLARQEYRRALTSVPDDWDAKFNLDVASRLIRDFPSFERTAGDTVKTDRKKIWADIPGVPKGLP
jgi:mxaK protein